MKSKCVWICLSLYSICSIASVRGGETIRAGEQVSPVSIGLRDFPAANGVDGFIQERLSAANMEPSSTCRDDEFMRRVYLDVCGAIPSAKEAREFLADTRSDRRAILIDKLLKSERYADHWEVMWGDLLREHSNAKKKEGTVPGSYREWIRKTLEQNMPYDQFAKTLITASGSPEENPAVNFFLRDMMNRVETVNTVSQVFMGTSMACAQCHDHPFDKWTQDDFHGLMAFFGRTDISRSNKKNMYASSQVTERATGDYHMGDKDANKVKKQRDKTPGDVVDPVFAWDRSKKIASTNAHRRESLASFVVESRQFAEVQVNRLWGNLFGRGLVEPMDDFRAKNPPSHPELLAYLTDEFVKSKFDNKHVLRLILNSAAYQRSSLPNDSNRADKEMFSHHILRRMSSEEVFDSVLMATGFDKGIQDLPGLVKDTAGTGKGGKKFGGNKNNMEWAADLPTPPLAGSFMGEFNQPHRDTTVIKRDDTGSITQALEMLNGKALNEAIDQSPLPDQYTQSKASVKQIVTDLYLGTLSRMPSDPEIALASKGSESLKEWLPDLQWALLNTREFMFVK